tara:strand:+ start:1074 stop:1289 length:216 start_codon:yes stop_codon:yes gene_type:complete
MQCADCGRFIPVGHEFDTFEEAAHDVWCEDCYEYNCDCEIEEEQRLIGLLDPAVQHKLKKFQEEGERAAYG